MVRKAKRAASTTVVALVFVVLSSTPALGAAFHSEVAHTELVGSQIGEDTYTFSPNSFTIKCKSNSFQGTTTTAATSTVDLTPAFSNCTTFGAFIAVLETNGCVYRYYAEGGWEADQMAIVCPPGQAIIIKTHLCKVTIPEQYGLAVTFTNEGSGKGRDIKITHSITGLQYSQAWGTQNGCTQGAFSNGTYSGATTVKGFNTSGEQVGIARLFATPAEDPSSGDGGFHPEVSHAIWNGSQVANEEDVITFNAGTWRCSNKAYAGTAVSTTTASLTLDPSFSDCVAFGFVNTTVDPRGCSFRYHAKQGEGSSYAMSVVCPQNQAMVVTAFNCHVRIPAQSGLGKVTYTNEGVGKSRDITISHAVTGLIYTQTSKAFPGCTAGTYSNATYSGTTTVKGLSTEGTQVGIWVA